MHPFALLQQLLPTRLLSRLMHSIASSRYRPLKNLLIRAFMKLFRIDLSEAVMRDPLAYESFNAFFTRALKPAARPLPEDPAGVASPVDGTLGQFGELERDLLLQAKGMTYSAAELLGDADAAAPFLGGRFATIYLAPTNYHRVHMPLTGTLRQTRYVPGRLFGVNPMSVRGISRLFTRNERLVCLFDTAAGPMAVVLVGAFCVGGMETVWSGTVTPPHRRSGGVTDWPVENTATRLGRGDEMGRFNLGSTVILLLGAGAADWASHLKPDAPVRMGQSLGHLTPGA
ncbi:MAG: archaetidylserine decarboxylase [Salinisphaeraceae bacterium]